MGEPPLVFDGDLVHLFARASGDANPLHTEQEYARATPFGEPVVFGVLAGLAVLARMPVAARIGRVRMSFREPVFPATPHQVEVTADHGVLRADGRVVVSVSVDRTLTAQGDFPAPPADPAPMRERPAEWSPTELSAGVEVGGRYVDRPVELVRRLGLTRSDLQQSIVDALLWSSYLAGMELPGRQALLSSVTVTSVDTGGRVAGYRYRSRVTRLDTRFGLMRQRGWLWAGEAPSAEVELETFVRPAERVVNLAAVRAGLPVGPRMTGQVAVVVGASRGLGAATALALAERGCAVVGCYRTSRRRAAEISEHPLVELVPGDAADSAFCQELADRVGQRYGRIDFLVCCAGPPLRPSRVCADGADAIARYVADSVRLVAAPVGAFTPLLDRADGSLLVTSSQALAAPVADWPHHVAAKAAVEHLARACGPAHPRWRILLARLPMLDTDLVSPLLATEERMSPVTAAAALLNELAVPRTAGCHLVAVCDAKAPDPAG